MFKRYKVSGSLNDEQLPEIETNDLSRARQLAADYRGRGCKDVMIEDQATEELVEDPGA